MDQKWIAGWSLPGCIPEMEPAVFDTEAEAEAWIAEERERFAEDFDTDPYVYWVEPYFGEDEGGQDG